MNTFEHLEEKIQNMKDEKIIKTKKSPLQSVIISVTGILLLLLGIIVVNNETISLLLAFLGTLLAIPGIILFIINMGKNSVDYIYEPTGKRFKKHTVYLDEQDARSMMSCINNDDFNRISQFKKTMDSGHLLECRGTNDGQIFLVQLSQYIPHDYVPASPVAILRNKEAKAMLDWIKS